MDVVTTPRAPKAAGHYSQGIVHGGLVYVSGQLPLDPGSSALVGADNIEVQTERTLRNVEAILIASGSAMDRTLSMTVYITSRGYWPKVNETIARVMGSHRPARAVIPVPELREGCLIEIQAIGAIG